MALLYLRAGTGHRPYTRLAFELAVALYPFCALCAFELAIASCTPLVAKLPSCIFGQAQGRPYTRLAFELAIVSCTPLVAKHS